MWYLLIAVFTASLLGSLHCVGMCGPLALLASGAGSSVPRTRLVLSTTLYHLGRLSTYLLAGGVGGLLGSLVDVGGQMIGWQVTAARLAGAAMVGIGVWKLWRRWPLRSPGRGTTGTAAEAAAGNGSPPVQNGGGIPPAASVPPSRVAAVLVRLRPLLAKQSPAVRAYGIGFLTTFLPCGWLYLFALVAAATGSPLMGAVVMAAFWVGTLPALTGLILGARWLSGRTAGFVPVATALLLVATGCFTASGRGFAAMTSLESLQGTLADAPASTTGASTEQLLERVRQAPGTDLPCCEGGCES